MPEASRYELHCTRGLGLRTTADVARSTLTPPDRLEEGAMATIKTELCIEHGRDACFMIKTDACAVHVPMDEMGEFLVSLGRLR